MSVSVTVNTACIRGLKLIPLTLNTMVVPGVPGATIVSLPAASALEFTRACALRHPQCGL